MLSSRAHHQRSTSVESSVTLGRDSPDLLEVVRDEVIDLTAYESDLSCPGLLQDGEVPLEIFRTASGIVIRRDDLVQVPSFSLGAYEVEFILVKIIAQDRSGTKKIRGIPLARSRTLAGTLLKKINELFMILHVQRLGNVAAPPHLVDVHGVLRKRKLIRTNARYQDESFSPWANFHYIRDNVERRRVVELHGHLVCRWKLVTYFTPQGLTGRPEETAFERLDEAEVLEWRYRKSGAMLSTRWRGSRARGGSWPPRTLGFDVVDLGPDGLHPESSASPIMREFRQRYTLFDSFSGAGGVSRGAQSAGFHILAAVDKSPEVWDTYLLNFPHAELFPMSIDEFILDTTRRKRVMRPDVLHLSPPCQFFSPAHTHMSANDDMNIFALFSCHTLIDKLRPRLVTLEQTFGITQDRHNLYLSRLIGDFTELGYSIRWKVVRLAAWGLAQSRKRLIMIAAGPGERLPPFPGDTHSETGVGGLKRLTTVRQAIRGIRRGDDLHDVARTKHYHPPRPRLADGLMGTITTSGAEAYHPDGHRDFTLREYACLQGFPRTHKFRGTVTSIRRQIGNAFPPNTVEVLYRHLHEWLMKEDNVSPAVDGRPPLHANVMIVDDEEDVFEVLPESQQSPPRTVPSPNMGEVIEIDASGPGSSGAFVDLT